MALTEKDFGSANVAASGNTTLYTVPGATRAILRTCKATNKDASTQVTVKMLYRPSATDLQYGVAVLEAGETAEFVDEGSTLELPAAALLKVNLSAAISVDVIVTGVEVT